MAIDTIPYRDADNLVRAQKSFYPVRIPVSHWQLRHYISSPETDLLYYASSHDIYCLNTATKKRKLVATLPFEARCTAAGYGWVCVGGEDDGHFAAIKLDGGSRTALDVDSALPVEPRRSGAAVNGRRAASVKVERIGEEIVNSISIHRIQDEDAHLDDIVAVLTNNDKTVRVYSLPQGLETTVRDLPFAMNHATISPDGQTLIAVGDFNQAYFFQRELTVPPPQIPKPHNRLTSSSCEWTLMSVVGLHASETTSGYFTTAWSPSGHLVAVGSEGGYITVFDMEMLMSPEFDDEEAIVAVVPGSRPELPSFPGAVRSMTFAPDPWDLLIWAEDQGRICVGDLRTGLKTKQVVNLEPKNAGLEKLVYEEVPGDGVPPANAPAGSRDIHDLEQEFLRRYGQVPDNATAVNFATEYIEARRRQRQQRQDMASLRSVANSAGVNALEDDPQGLTAREQQILESLRTTRQREEARAHGNGDAATGVNYTSPDNFHADSRSVTPHNREPASARAINEILNSVPDSFPELSRSSGTNTARTSSDQPHILPSLDEIQDVVSGRQRSSGSWLSRTTDGSRLPRRRASVVLPPSYAGGGAPSTTWYTSDGRLREGYGAPGQALSSAHPYPGDEENPWRTIEEHMTLARGPLFEGAAQANASSSPLPPPLATSSFRPSDVELANELAAERARARSLARQRERVRGMRTAVEATGANATTAISATEQQVRRLAGFPEGYEMLMRRGQARGMGFIGAGSREVGVRTAGLAISDDGRRLWAACEEGIFEVEIDLKGRMFWPSVEMR